MRVSNALLCQDRRDMFVSKGLGLGDLRQRDV